MRIVIRSSRLKLSERMLARLKASEDALNELLTPEARAELDAAIVAEVERRWLTGDD